MHGLVELGDGAIVEPQGAFEQAQGNQRPCQIVRLAGQFRDTQSHVYGRLCLIESSGEEKHVSQTVENAVFKIEVFNRNQDQSIPKLPLRTQKILTGFVERMGKAQMNFDSGDGVAGAIRSGQGLFQNRYRLGVFVGVREALVSVEFCLDLG